MSLPLLVALALALLLALTSLPARAAGRGGAPSSSNAAPQSAPLVPAAPRESTVVLDDDVQVLDAEPLALAWTDTSGQAGVEQASAALATRFARLAPATIHRLGTHDALWLHLRLMRAPDSRKAWMIEFPLPLLDMATVYQRDAQGHWRGETAGDTIAVASWPEPGRYPFFRLELPPGEARDVFLRIRHTTAVTIPVRLLTETAHNEYQQIEYLLLGVVFGALLLLIVACSVQGWVHRDRVYGWYTAYAGITTLAVAAYTGVAGHLLWSGWDSLSDTSQGALALLAGGSALLFVRHLSGLIIRYPRIDRLVRALGLVGIVAAFTYASLPRPLALSIMGGYLVLVAMVNLWVSALAWRRGDRVGLWMLAAYLPLALAVLAVVLRVFGLMPSFWFTQYGVVVAMAVEVPLLLVALNIRSQERHGAEIREQALASQDALTGLLAPHLFHDRLRQAAMRFKRDRESAAVIFIDLVNYERIKAIHGLAVADQSLLRSVIKLRRLLRDVDTVSRIGESRFGLIMEGVSSRAVVTDRAARLIASGLMPLKGLKPDVTLHFHAAALIFSERLMPAADVGDALAEVLAGMSSRTRRPIRFLEPEVTAPMPLEPDSQQDADEDDPQSSLPRPL